MVRWVRLCIWCLLAATAAALMIPLASGQSVVGGRHAGVALFIMLLVIWAGALAVTSPRSPVGGRAIGIATLGGVVTGAAIYTLMPFEQIGTPLAGRTPAGLGILLGAAVVLGAPIFALLRVGSRSPGETSYAFLHLLAVACVVVFGIALVAIQLFPGAIPDIVPVSVVWQGDGPAKALQYSRENSAIEAVDPYVLPLILGTLFFGVMGVIATVMRRPRSAQPA